MTVYTSECFCNAELETLFDVAAERMASDHDGLYWLGYSERNAESTPPNSNDKVNETEAMLVVQAVEREMNHGHSIMVFALYKSQESLIRDCFIERDIKETTECRITTVDQVQGLEADVVNLSTARCNEEKEIGFVENPSHINVAVSCMKRVIVMGNVETMTSNTHWSYLYHELSKVV